MAFLVVAMASNLLALTRVPKRYRSRVPKRTNFCVPKRPPHLQFLGAYHRFTGLRAAQNVAYMFEGSIFLTRFRIFTFFLVDISSFSSCSFCFSFILPGYQCPSVLTRFLTELLMRICYCILLLVSFFISSFLLSCHSIVGAWHGHFIDCCFPYASLGL